MGFCGAKRGECECSACDVNLAAMKTCGRGAESGGSGWGGVVVVVVVVVGGGVIDRYVKKPRHRLSSTK